MPQHESATDLTARLAALRDHFAARLADASDRDATAMGRLIKEIDADLARLEPPAQEGDELDEIAARRASRGSSTAAS